MTFTQILVIVIIAVPLGLAATNRIRVDIAALTIALLLATAQYLGYGVLGEANQPSAAAEAMRGFSQPVTLTLMSLFIITRVLDRTGVTRWLSRRILEISGESNFRVITLFTISGAVLGLFMNKVAVGALLLPSAVNAARRKGMKASKLLMPMVFGTLLGGMATYLTTANIIVDDLLRSSVPPQQPLNFLDFTPVGGLIAIIGLIYLCTIGWRMLPERTPMAEQMLIMPTGSELEEFYQLGERLWEARVKPWSKFSNQTLAQTKIGENFGLSVVAIWHGRQAIFNPSADHLIRPNDILVIVGREDRVSQLVDSGLEIGRENANGHISERGVSFVEAILSPHSRAEGQSLKHINFRKRFGFTAVALLREGRSYRTDVADFELKRGDAFLLVGSRSNLRKLQHNDMFIVLESDISDQPLQRIPAALALGVTGASIVISILGFPIYLASFIAALLLVVLGLLSMEDAYRAIEWSVIFVVAGMYAVSMAMVQTGIAEMIGTWVVAFVQPFGPLGLAAGCFLLSALLTHIMGGQVTALVTGPIAISAALSLGTSPQAMVVATAIGCSAAFLTPLAHSINMLIIGPGNYQSQDFVRLGLPMMVISFIGVIVGMVLFWRI
jgi:di/tricarboxylate transporter